MENYLNNEFESLSRIISRIHFYKGNIDKIFNDEAIKIEKTHNSIPDWSLKKKDGTMYFFHYQSPISGDDLFVTPQKLPLKDQLIHNSMLCLRVHHWLLVEAYEAFESFLMNAFAYCGLMNNGLWEPSRNWNKHGSKKLKDYRVGRKPYHQLDAIRKNSEYFRKYETTNLIGKNFKTLFSFIEKIRHISVHEQGYSPNLQDLKTRIQNQVKDNNFQELSLFIESYFIDFEGKKLVDLLDFEDIDSQGVPTGATRSTLTGFFRLLLEYALLITESIKHHENVSKRI